MIEKRYPVVYVTNEGYALPLMASLVILFKYAQPTTIYDIYIVNYQLAEAVRTKLIQHVKKYSPRSEAIFLDVLDANWQRIPAIQSWGKEINYRVLLADLLPDLSKVLYLDVDTLVQTDLAHLFAIDLSNKALAGMAIDYEQGHSGMSRIMYLLDSIATDDNWKVDFRQRYVNINTGVLLINLEYWRTFEWKDKLLKLLSIMESCVKIDEDPRLWLPDQEAINTLLTLATKPAIAYLPYSYNCGYPFTPEQLKDRNAHSMSYLDDFYKNLKILRDSFADRATINDEHFDNVQIIHMISAKPWHKYDSPYRE